MRPINEIIIHCTATPEGRPVRVAEINEWHLERGWSGIGYHRVIHLDGRRETGRPMERIGAHVKGHNTGTIGVVYVGGMNRDFTAAADTRTPAQKEALLAEIIDLRDRFDIGKISGHHDYDAGKACPSFDARPEYAHLFPAMEEIASFEDAVLQRGDIGPVVVIWTEQLHDFREMIGHKWPVQPTDTFDHTIEMVTIWFQKHRGIVADGIVGPQTRDEMDRALAGKPPFRAMEL
ncbi:peptidoglycan recognition protein family protein [Martelella mediterranea]|uniref:N-acetyl-anhydromuramyl-L-alanine amidase AmpD n=1 Tax=Martelella mediterranea TaxID=293089 RepID=A0A4R3NU23_9HYPH|nr:peptidoglycan-binding domain-containing protein [Martelella mediterranea]TCT39607.1 N-acetyl-anhydromuramyl-L-alanine amidase AmpD [Martelella mediterranea]